MNMKERFIEYDHKRIYSVEWLTAVDNPLGNIVIVHGMAEHINRYSLFAEYAVKKGYNVFGYDQRGHGFTAESKADLGHIDDKSGWQSYIDDLKCVIEQVQSIAPQLKNYVLGHSMGSFVSRDFSIRYPEMIDGLILSGSTDCLLSELIMGLTLAKTELLVKGPTGKAERVNGMLTKKYAKAFKNRETDYDWLCTDPMVVREYMDDPYSGYCPKTSFFTAFFGGLISLHEKSTYQCVAVDLPMLILSGQQDPVTNMGLGTLRLFEKLRKQGVEDIRVKIYPGMRHEILNEVDKESVFKDIMDWIDAHGGGKLSMVKNNSTIS